MSVASNLPSFGITASVHAGNHNDAITFDLEENAVRETPHSRPPDFPMENLKAQRPAFNCPDCRFHRERKTGTEIGV